MTGFDTIGIPIAFVIIVSILLWHLIGAKGKWYLKAIFIAIALYTSVGLWTSIDGMLGWPTAKSPPEIFQIHWLTVEEPNKITGDSGAIYLWASDMGQEKADKNPFLFGMPVEKGKSRLYVLPYSRNAHEQSENILTRLKNGESVIASKGKPGEGEEGNSQAGREGEAGEGSSDGSMSQEQDYIFHILPPAKLPDK
jgi:hypothetical protein